MSSDSFEELEVVNDINDLRLGDLVVGPTGLLLVVNVSSEHYVELLTAKHGITRWTRYGEFCMRWRRWRRWRRNPTGA